MDKQSHETNPRGKRSFAFGEKLDSLLTDMKKRSGQSATAVIREALLRLDAEWRKEGR